MSVFSRGPCDVGSETVLLMDIEAFTVYIDRTYCYTSINRQVRIIEWIVSRCARSIKASADNRAIVRSARSIGQHEGTQ